MFKDLVMNGAATLDNIFDPKERARFIHASEAGTCIRKQWYSKHNADAAPEDRGYARRGWHLEPYMVKALKAANVPLLYTGKDQLTLQDKARKISCHPDGVIQYEDHWIVPEFKSIDPRTNRNNLPRKAHVTQVEICTAMVDEAFDHPGVRGVLVYMDASNFDDIIEFNIPLRPAVLDETMKRARKTMATRNVDSLDREGKKTNECKDCVYKPICKPGETTRTKVKSNRGYNLDKIANRYVDIGVIERTLKTEKDEIKEDIKAELVKRKTNSTRVGDIDINWTTVAGRKSLDKKAVEAAGIDLAPFEKTGSSSERLEVKRLT